MYIYIRMTVIIVKIILVVNSWMLSMCNILMWMVFTEAFHEKLSSTIGDTDVSSDITVICANDLIHTWRLAIHKYQ